MPEGTGGMEERSRTAGAAGSGTQDGTREAEAGRGASGTGTAEAEAKVEAKAGAAAASEGASDRTFTQTEVERIVQERLAAEQERGRGEREKLVAAERAKTEAMLTRLKQRAVEAEVAMHVAKLDLVDAEIALAWVENKVEYDAHGEPTNVEKLLRELAVAKPFLVRTGGMPVSPTSTANPGGGKAGSRLDVKNPPSWGVAFGKR